MPPYNANSACFNIGEFNMNCCKIASVSHPPLNFSNFFFPNCDCKWTICVSYLVNSLLLIGGLPKVCTNQKQTRKCSIGAHGVCMCKDQAIWLLSLLQIVDMVHLYPHQPQVIPDGCNNAHKSDFWDSLPWNLCSDSELMLDLKSTWWT